MPRGDRTGPNGLGSRTGRGAGLCNGNSTGGFTSSGQGGRNMGGGRRINRQGFGNANATPYQGIQTESATGLQQQMNHMQQQLNNIVETIKQLGK
jgi:hypothetical protein